MWVFLDWWDQTHNLQVNFLSWFLFLELQCLCLFLGIHICIRHIIRFVKALWFSDMKNGHSLAFLFSHSSFTGYVIMRPDLLYRANLKNDKNWRVVIASNNFNICQIWLIILRKDLCLSCFMGNLSMTKALLNINDWTGRDVIAT